MKNRKLIIWLAGITIAVGASIGVCEEPKPSFALESGAYILQTTLTTVDAKHGDIDFSAELKVTEDPKGKKTIAITALPLDPNLRFHTKKALELRGVLSENSLMLYNSDNVGDDNGIVFLAATHFIGKLVSGNVAKGTMSTMVNGEIGDRGKWTLKRAKEKDGKDNN